MNTWTVEQFERNNRKLHNYLNNIDNAIILLCANDQNAVTCLCDMLKEQFSFQCISYRESHLSFPQLIDRGDMKNRLCFYDIMEVDHSTDVVKTINLSRDILRKVGIVVFIVPTFIMEKIRLENPNLYDYITLSLNYNINYDNYISPIYSEEDKDFVPKKIRTEKKKFAIMNRPENIQSVGDFYRFLDHIRYGNVKDEDIERAFIWLNDDLSENIAIVNFLDQEKKDYRNLKLQLNLEMASALQQKNYYSHAILLCDNILYQLKGETENKTIALEALQKKAFCYYKKEDIQSAKKTLTELMNRICKINNDLWFYKTYHDFGVCMFKEHDFEQAEKIFNIYMAQLRKMDAQTVQRRFRVVYNLIMIKIAKNEPIVSYRDAWEELKPLILQEFGQQSIIYLRYMLLQSWILLLDGRLELAKEEALAAYETARVILPENDEIKITLNYILSIVAMQQGEMEKNNLYMKKMKHFLSNRDDLNEKYKCL